MDMLKKKDKKSYLDMFKTERNQNDSMKTRGCVSYRCKLRMDELLSVSMEISQNKKPTI